MGGEWGGAGRFFIRLPFAVHLRSEVPPLREEFAVEGPVLDGLEEVHGLDFFGAGEVGEGGVEIRNWILGY